MSFSIKTYNGPLKHCLLPLIVILLLALSQEMTAQEPPPRPVQVTVLQNLGFGAFAHGLFGGSVIVNTGGARSYTGDIVLLNLGFSFSAAIFKLVANPGTLISILNGPDAQLIGSNGGFMILHIGDSFPLSPFVINSVPPDFTEMNIGGTLTVGNTAANPPGNYSGTFDITFIQE
jgi:hypothetical protein